MPNPLCFVLMPFGRKSSPSGEIIDFDAVYLQIIKPAIVAAALDPIRADEEQGGGIIHKPMFRAACYSHNRHNLSFSRPAKNG